MVKCEICGRETRNPFSCQICGKKVCINCIRVITTPFSSQIPPSTLPYPSTIVPKIPATVSDEKDIYICKDCADLLHLSLRVAKIKYGE